MKCEHISDPFYCLRCEKSQCILTDEDEIIDDPAIKHRYMKRDYIKHKERKEKIRPSDEDMILVTEGRMTYQVAYQRAYRKVMPEQQRKIYNKRQSEYQRKKRAVALFD